MILDTKHFGKIEIDESQIITFEKGLLGFESIKRYIFIRNENEDIPFHWLQAVDKPEPAFVITIPFLFKENYEFDIPKKIIEQLEIEKKDDIVVYSIAVVPDDIQKTTINLQGPLIINTNNKKGKQIILDREDYGLKYCIFKETVYAMQK